MRPQTKKSLDVILDVFGGADGGIQFAKFMALVETLDVKASQGNEDAALVLEVMERFRRLVEIA